MKPKLTITTSWDDGHPLDQRVAELLTKHGLAGTFYTPRRWSRPTMDEHQLRGLADAGFELGGHTIDHVVLTEVPDAVASAQIRDCRSWLSDVSGQACGMFCPPRGRFTARHTACIHDAGFVGYRTVELWSMDRSRRSEHGLLELPTTIQAHPHRSIAVLRNLIKRGAAVNLCHFLRLGLGRGWVRQLEKVLHRAAAQGGTLHLWGHSWEVEEHQQWARLEEGLRLLGAAARDHRTMTNGALCALDRSKKSDAPA
jgi:peptidoglycan/xylan/chitin deacetylase (PgdA/CDA1 family)